LPVVTYGAELWAGIDQQRFSNLQKLVHQGVKWMVCGYDANNFAMGPLLAELGIRQVSSEALARRGRAYVKYATLKTTIHLFYKTHPLAVKCTYTHDPLEDMGQLWDSPPMKSGLTNAMKNVTSKQTWRQLKDSYTVAQLAMVQKPVVPIDALQD
jgi:hypothetical protein